MTYTVTRSFHLKFNKTNNLHGKWRTLIFLTIQDVLKEHLDSHELSVLTGCVILYYRIILNEVFTIGWAA